MTTVSDSTGALGVDQAGDVTQAAAPRRDRYIDSLRALALGRVVAYHWFGWAWLPFVFPSMGIMFALAGSLVAASLDRADHRPWAVLRKRTFRLLPPLWALGLVLVPLMLLHDGWIAVQDEGGSPLSLQSLLYWVVPINDPASSDWGYAEGLTVPLWYIRAYFWFLLLSPAFLWLFRRWPKRVLALPLVTVTLAGFGVLPVSLDGDGSSRIVATMAMFGACWLLGFAHHDDKIRQLSLAFVLPVSALLIGLGTYWTATTNGWHIDDSELGEALYCLGFVLLLLRFYPSFDWLRRRPFLDKLVTVINSRAMTIYLWGNVAILLASLLMSSALAPDILVGSEWGYQLAGFLVVWLLIGVAVVAIGWVEDVAGGRAARLNPWPRTAGGGHRHEPLRAPSVTSVPRRPSAPAPATTWRQLVSAGATGAFGMLAVAGAVAAFWIASDDASVAPGGGDTAVTVLREAPPAPAPVAVPVDDGDGEVVYRATTELIEEPENLDLGRFLGEPVTTPTAAPLPSAVPSGDPVPTAPSASAAAVPPVQPTVEPTPSPEPAPTPTPVPEPTPTPIPEPQPATDPDPTATPEGEPTPSPEPETAPTTTLGSSPASTPEPTAQLSVSPTGDPSTAA